MQLEKFKENFPLTIKNHKRDILDILECNRTIVTHPDNLPLLKEIFEEQSVVYGSYIMSIKPIQIIENRDMARFNEYWVRTDVMPDKRFYELVTEEELKNPT